MFITIKKRLELLRETQRKVDAGEIVFDPEKANFGFKRMEQLFPVVQDEIKGYPCVAYDKFVDPIKFGIKVIPLELKYEDATHPCRIELALLKEFTELVVSDVTPHVTFYFKEMSVPNKKKAMTRFPLKSLRKEIFKNSNVLVAEYVPGGSIEEWIQEQPNISEKQWKYIIFAVTYTLLVLQDKYRFLHNDFHYGNILVDTSIDPTNKSFCRYVISRPGMETLTFNVQNVGLLPKIWDFEFASTYAPEATFQNGFFKRTEENIPHDFNPYYDLHCFLTSLLELEIPERLRDFILDLYPEEVLPPFCHEGSPDSDSRDASRVSTSEEDTDSTSYDGSCDSRCSCYRYHCRPEEYYKTDESTHATTTTETSSESADATTSTFACDSSSRGRGRPRHRSSSLSVCSTACSTDERCRSVSTSADTTTTTSYYTEESEIRTEYMLGDRMLNGTEKIFKLPSPLDILESDYFAEYRKPISPKTKAGRNGPDCTFEYTLTDSPAPSTISTTSTTSSTSTTSTTSATSATSEG